MSLLDKFRKKKNLPTGARPATRRRRAGGGQDEGYVHGGEFYLMDGSSTSGYDYAEPARVDSSYSDNSPSQSSGSASYGGYSSSDSGSYGGYSSGSSYGGGSSYSSDSGSSGGGSSD